MLPLPSCGHPHLVTGRTPCGREVLLSRRRESKAELIRYRRTFVVGCNSRHRLYATVPYAGELVPVTNTREPSGAIAMSVPYSSLFAEPLKRASHSFAPVVASYATVRQSSYVCGPPQLVPVTNTMHPSVDTVTEYHQAL